MILHYKRVQSRHAVYSVAHMPHLLTITSINGVPHDHKDVVTHSELYAYATYGTFPNWSSRSYLEVPAFEQLFDAYSMVHSAFETPADDMEIDEL
jgi:hypothetical protein